MQSSFPGCSSFLVKDAGAKPKGQRWSTPRSKNGKDEPLIKLPFSFTSVALLLDFVFSNIDLAEGNQNTPQE
jgi:hypothetical protein